MLCNFKKAFKPTKEDKKEQAIQMLKTKIWLVEKESCLMCKHYGQKDILKPDMIRDTTIGYCELTGEEIPEYNDHCDNWEVNIFG